MIDWIMSNTIWFVIVFVFSLIGMIGSQVFLLSQWSIRSNDRCSEKKASRIFAVAFAFAINVFLSGWLVFGSAIMHMIQWVTSNT